MANQSATFIVVVAVIVAMIGYRIYRQTREQRWSVTRMWFAPAAFLALTALIVAADSQASRLAPALAVAGLVLGVGVGLYQGTHTTVRVDKAAQSLFVKTSPIPQTPGGPPFATVSPVTAMTGSALLVLAAGAVLGLRIYMQRRYNEAPRAAGDKTTG